LSIGLYLSIIATFNKCGRFPVQNLVNLFMIMMIIIMECLTVSSVRGSQYIQGAALVFWNRSSSSLAGGSSAAFSAEKTLQI
jgi:hypothetical protein